MVCFYTLLLIKKKKKGILEQMAPESRKQFRKLVIEMVLATDMK